MAVADTTFPVQRILEKYNEEIQNYVELVTLAKALTTNHSQVFSFAVFTDITNTVRTKEQNVGRLLQVVQARGLQGFVKFVTTLLNDRFNDHVTLGRLLLDEGKQPWWFQNNLKKKTKHFLSSKSVPGKGWRVSQGREDTAYRATEHLRPS